VAVDERRTFSAAHAAMLRRLGAARRYPRDAVLFVEGDVSDHVALINRGTVKATSVSGSGYTSLLALRGRNELIGELAALDSRPRSATVTALTDVEVSVIPAARFRALLATDPGIALELLEIIVCRLREADRRRLEYGAYPAGQRIARVLLDLAQSHGRPVDGRPGAVVVETRQQELAGAAGTSRESVVRALRDLHDHGAVTTRRGEIVITDVRLLTALTTGAPP